MVSSRPEPRCSVDGCDGAVNTRGMCAAHYRRLLQTGRVGAPVVQRRNRGPRPGCAVAGCPRPVAAKGLCKAHWARQHRNGDPGPAAIMTHAAPYGDSHACSVTGCRAAAHSRQLCKRHYDQHRRARQRSTTSGESESQNRV
jgi:hypothetical protein